MGALWLGFCKSVRRAHSSSVSVPSASPVSSGAGRIRAEILQTNAKLLVLFLFPPSPSPSPPQPYPFASPAMLSSVFFTLLAPAPALSFLVTANHLVLSRIDPIVTP